MPISYLPVPLEACRYDKYLWKVQFMGWPLHKYAEYYKELHFLYVNNTCEDEQCTMAMIIVVKLSLKFSKSTDGTRNRRVVSSWLDCSFHCWAFWHPKSRTKLHHRSHRSAQFRQADRRVSVVAEQDHCFALLANPATCDELERAQLERTRQLLHSLVTHLKQGRKRRKTCI